MSANIRELAIFQPAIDSKLFSSNLTRLLVREIGVGRGYLETRWTLIADLRAARPSFRPASFSRSELLAQ